MTSFLHLLSYNMSDLWNVNHGELSGKTGIFSFCYFFIFHFYLIEITDFFFFFCNYISFKWRLNSFLFVILSSSLKWWSYESEFYGRHTNFLMSSQLVVISLNWTEKCFRFKCFWLNKFHITGFFYKNKWTLACSRPQGVVVW